MGMYLRCYVSIYFHQNMKYTYNSQIANNKHHWFVFAKPECLQKRQVILE